MMAGIDQYFYSEHTEKEKLVNKICFMTLLELDDHIHIFKQYDANLQKIPIHTEQYIDKAVALKKEMQGKNNAELVSRINILFKEQIKKFILNDFEKIFRYDKMQVNELIAISVGLDPLKMDLSWFEEFQVLGVKHDYITKSIDLLLLCEKKYKKDMLKLVPLKEFFGWLDSIGIEYSDVIKQYYNDIKVKNDQLSLREKQTFLKIIGALIYMIKDGKDNNGLDFCSELNSQNDIIEYITTTFSDDRGLSKRTLEDKFSLANQEFKI